MLTQSHSTSVGNVYDKSFVISSDFKLQDVTNYLKTLPCHGLKLVKSGSDIISEGVISALETEAKRVGVGGIFQN